MNIILYDNEVTHKSLYPLTLTRPVSGLRVGILTIAEKWARLLGGSTSFHCAGYLSALFPLKVEEENRIINSSILPDDQLIRAIQKQPHSSVLVNENHFLAAFAGKPALSNPGNPLVLDGLKKIYYRHPVRMISKPWDLFLENNAELFQDFVLITRGRESRPIPDPFTRTYRDRNIFIEEGVDIKAAVINAENGPVYIGKNASLQEGAVIRGPAAILEGAVLSMGAKIRENTTIGPYSKIGGEVKNSIVFGSSNKAHEGYLGNSVIGEWCNLGADTNCSNLKNNYSNVRVWDYLTNSFQDSGQQFCGVFMGDHSKTSIGTMINTGSVIGVSANVFGEGLTPKFIPSFSWGGYKNNKTYEFQKAMSSAGKMMARRNQILDVNLSEMLNEVFKITDIYRNAGKQ
jgi:UDP-N-acetylglucosamine diphosphorylase/glucosamine-1-phosphate N-acetyltransferase